MNKVSITVSGPAQSGKTHIVAAIQEMFAEHGMRDRTTVIHTEDDTAYISAHHRVTCPSHRVTLAKLLPEVTVELVESYGGGQVAPMEPIEDADIADDFNDSLLAMFMTRNGLRDIDVSSFGEEAMHEHGIALQAVRKLFQTMNRKAAADKAATPAK